jgi:putative ABC transport system permease protein
MTPLESVWEVHADHGPATPATPLNPKQAETEEADHDHDHDADHEHEHEHEADAREITALLIEFRNKGMGMVMLPRMINEQTSMQAALPAIEINKLLTKLLPIALNTGRGIAIAIMIISAISVFVSLYNSLRERQYELALMRTLGGSRQQLFWMVVLEGLFLAVLGLGIGLLASRLGLGLLNYLVVSGYHYDFGDWHFLPAEGWLAGLTILIGFLAAALPGLQAFRLNISRTLADG